eukprot:PhM_4_TR5897/c0_g1_i1/m.100966/K01940/argG, ASS1; argininosuccinate synthase
MSTPLETSLNGSTSQPTQPHRRGSQAAAVVEHCRVLFAYSGDLKGSCVLQWLLDTGYEVYAMICDVGQRGNLEEVKKRALSMGAAKAFIEDVKQDFVTNFVYRSIQANAVYDGRLPLGTALSRPCIAKRQIEVARREQCQYVAHGASGSTSDHCRFELVYYALDSQVKIVAPFRDRRFQEVTRTRDSMLRFAEEKGFAFRDEMTTVAPGDMNLLTLTHHGARVEDPNKTVDSDVYIWTVDPREAPDTPEFIDITFKKGLPIKVAVVASPEKDEQSENGRIITSDHVEMLRVLNAVGARHGVGRIDMVVSAQIGVKFRNVVECPGGTILRCAHNDLEGLVMDREVRRLRDMMSPKFAEIVYNGFWCSPEMEFINAAVQNSQEMVDGVVRVRVFKGTVMAVDRQSRVSMYDRGVQHYRLDTFSTPEDTAGFVRCSAARLRTAAALQKQQTEQR